MANRKLLIAILGSRGIPAQYGGFETFAEQLSVRLAAHGHSVTVYAESTDGQVSNASYKGVLVRRMPVPNWGKASVIAFDIRCLWDARQGFDVVYMLGYGAAFACWLPKVSGTPVWINIDGLEWRRSKWSRVARAYLRCMEWITGKVATRVIADAQAMVNHFQASHGNRTPCSFLAYGAPQVESQADARVLAKWGLTAGGYLLVVARMEPENHVLEIIRGFQASGVTLPLVVVGDHQRPTAYCRAISEAELSGVQLVGAVFDVDQLQQLRLGAAACIHGHSVGGTNPSLLEAMGCGNVVLAHDNPFNREVLGDAALYFHTEVDLALSLKAFVQMPVQEKLARSRQVRQIVSNRYSWDMIAAQYEALLLKDARKPGQSVCFSRGDA